MDTDYKGRINDSAQRNEPLAGLEAIVNLPRRYHQEARQYWLEAFTSWIHRVKRKAVLAHAQHITGIDSEEVDAIVQWWVEWLIEDCQQRPAKAEYIGSLEHAILKLVAQRVSVLCQRTTGIAQSTAQKV